MLHREACCVPPRSKEVQVPCGWSLPGTGIKPGLHVSSAGSSHKPEAHPPLCPKSAPATWHIGGLGSRRHAPAQPSGQSPMTGPTNNFHPKRSRRLSCSICGNQTPFRKGGGGGAYFLLRNPYSVGAGLQPVGLSAQGLNCRQLEARPGGPPPHTASRCGKSQREMNGGFAPRVLTRVDGGVVPP